MADTTKKVLTRAEASGSSFLRLQKNTNYGKKDDAFFLIGTLPDNVFVLQRLEYVGMEFVCKGKPIKTNSLDPFRKEAGAFNNDLETGRRNTKNEHYGEKK